MMLTIRDVEEAVCARFHLTPGDLRGRGRTHAPPRMIAMYLARHLTGNSLPRIGGYFRRDHTTVLAAVRRVDELSRKSESFRATLEECRALLLQSTPWKAQVARGMERAS